MKPSSSVAERLGGGRQTGKHVLSHMERYNGTRFKTPMNNCIPAPVASRSFLLLSEPSARRIYFFLCR